MNVGRIKKRLKAIEKESYRPWRPRKKHIRWLILTIKRLVAERARKPIGDIEMAHLRTVILTRKNETIVVDIFRSTGFDPENYGAWSIPPCPNLKWTGYSILELSAQWEKEGWVEVVPAEEDRCPDCKDTGKVKIGGNHIPGFTLHCWTCDQTDDSMAGQTFEFEDSRKGRKVALLNLMRDMVLLQNRVVILERQHQRFRGIGQREIEERAQKIVNEKLKAEIDRRVELFRWAANPKESTDDLVTTKLLEFEQRIGRLETIVLKLETENSKDE
jgi:hypothetical protein